MEIRVYPEYVGELNSFQQFIFSYFRRLHMCYEKHSEQSEAHIHCLLLDPIKPINIIQFKRRFQEYKKRTTKLKLRNNSFHIDVCRDETKYIEYLKQEKLGGTKEYYYLRHPYNFDFKYYLI